MVEGPVGRVLAEVSVPEQSDPLLLSELGAPGTQQPWDREIPEVLGARPEVGHLPLVWLLLHYRGVEGGCGLKHLRVAKQQLQRSRSALAVADQQPGRLRVQLVDDADHVL